MMHTCVPIDAADLQQFPALFNEGLEQLFAQCLGRLIEVFDIVLFML